MKCRNKKGKKRKPKITKSKIKPGVISICS